MISDAMLEAIVKQWPVTFIAVSGADIRAAVDARDMAIELLAARRECAELKRPVKFGRGFDPGD